MLEQYLAGLEARYVLLATADADPKRQSALARAGEVIQGYRDHRATKSSDDPKPLPDWNEALVADQLLTHLIGPEEASAELATQLTALKGVDENAHAALSIALAGIKPDDVNANARVSALLAAALRATQWKNTQRWIIRTLGTQYAARLRTAFAVGLLFALGLVVLDAYYGSSMSKWALSGIGFAAAAGLLGASFSAMVGHGDISKLQSIEEARAATGWQMITLRLGVGVAAAIIVYFFFESGLAEGALFPDLQQIGFGWVSPLGGDADTLRATAQTLNIQSVLLVETMESVNQRIAELTAGISDPAAGSKAAEIQKAGLAVAKDLAAVSELTTNSKLAQLQEKLQATEAALTVVNAEMGRLQEDWLQGGRPLGRLAPNPDLSKLVVWSFAAGFTQSLVPSMLAKVAPQEKTAG